MSVSSGPTPSHARFHCHSYEASLLPPNRQVGVPGGDGREAISKFERLCLSMRTLLAIRTLRGGWGLLILSEARGQALVWGVRGGRACGSGRRELLVSGHGGRIRPPCRCCPKPEGRTVATPGL